MTKIPEMDLLLESFGRNGRVNEAVLNAISESDLTFSDGQGGWSIGQHLGHLAEFRYGWLSLISPEHAKGIPSVLEGNEQDFHLSAQSIEELARAFSIGDEAAKTAVLAALSEGRSFKRAYESHPAHFLQHILVHDAHHRGQVMSLLRKNGRTAEEMEGLEEATWPVWRK
jgi:uncharacterized damage-inducible protein DinB